MNSTVSIQTYRFLQVVPGKIRCHRDSILANIECGISDNRRNGEDETWQMESTV